MSFYFLLVIEIILIIENNGLKIFENNFKTQFKLFYHRTSNFGPQDYNISGKVQAMTPYDGCNIDNFSQNNHQNPLVLPNNNDISNIESSTSFSSSSKLNLKNLVDANIFPNDPEQIQSTSYNNHEYEQIFENNIVLILRGNCTFAQKVYNAQLLGAIGVIIGNNNMKDDEWVIMYKEDSDSNEITIPSIFIPYDTYKWLYNSITGTSNNKNDNNDKNTIKKKKNIFAILDNNGEYELSSSNPYSLWISTIGFVVLIIPTVWCMIIIIILCKKFISSVIGRIRRHRHLKKIPIIRYKGTKTDSNNFKQQHQQHQEQNAVELTYTKQDINKDNINVNKECSELVIGNDNNNKLKCKECNNNNITNNNELIKTIPLQSENILLLGTPLKKDKKNTHIHSYSHHDFHDANSSESESNTPSKSLLKKKTKTYHKIISSKYYNIDEESIKFNSIFDWLKYIINICNYKLITNIKLIFSLFTNKFKYSNTLHKIQNIVTNGYLEQKQPHNDSCAICLDDFHYNEKIKLLPCYHGFHSKCIDPWLKLKSELCPMCKQSIFMKHSNSNKQSQSSQSNNNNNNNNNQNVSQESSILPFNFFNSLSSIALLSENNNENNSNGNNNGNNSTPTSNNNGYLGCLRNRNRLELNGREREREREQNISNELLEQNNDENMEIINS